MRSVLDAGTLANIASVISAFGAAMLFFRIQRENEMRELEETVDCFCGLATGRCHRTLLVVGDSSSNLVLRPETPGCSGWRCGDIGRGIYPRDYGPLPDRIRSRALVLGPQREGERDNPEPSERILVWSTAGAAFLFFVWRILPPSN